MAGNTKTIVLSPGVELDIVEWSSDEHAVYERDFPKMVSMYTKYSTNIEGKHLLGELYTKYKGVFAMLGQAAKNEMDPAAGMFNGMNAMTGYGMTLIRPGYLFPAAQGYTFDRALAALTKDNWYGWAHNAVIGAAYNATPLYHRKELWTAIIGFLELGTVPCAEEFQWEIDAKPLPVWNMVNQMRAMDVPLFEFPQVINLRPALQYRSQFKTGVVAGNMAMAAQGVTFIRAEWLRNTAPTLPTTNPP